MKEQLQQALGTLFESITATKDFVLDQAPEVIHQLLAYHLTIAYILTGLAILLWGAAAILAHRISIWERNRPLKHDSTPWGGFWTYVITVGATTTWLVALGVMKILKISIAPKVWLIEYAMRTF